MVFSVSHFIPEYKQWQAPKPRLHTADTDMDIIFSMLGTDKPIASPECQQHRCLKASSPTKLSTYVGGRPAQAS